MATYYFIGGEDSDFVAFGAADIDTSSTTKRRTTYSRCSLNTSSYTSYWMALMNAAATTFWTHVIGSWSIGAGGTMFGDMMTWYDSNSIPRLVLTSDATSISSAKWRLQKLDSAGTRTTLATSAVNVGVTTVNQQIDVYINYAVSGEFTLYLSGVSILSYTGDVTTNGVTQLDRMSLGHMTGTPVSSNAWWSECAICDSDTRGITGIMTMVPTGAGNSTAWNGAYTDIDEVTNSSDAISSTAVNDLEQFTLTPTSAISSGASIGAVAVNFRGHKGLTGPQNIQANVRISGIDYFSSNVSGLTYGNKMLQNVWTTNPDTSNTWLGSDLGAGFQIGVKSIT